MTEAVWNEDAVSCGQLVANLGADPAAGLSVSWAGQPSLGGLLGVTTPSGPLPAAGESYRRGVDHFSLHPPTRAFPFRTQLGWSAALCLETGVRLTLTVSLQTSLLDSQPELLLTTAAAGEPIEGATAWRVSAQPGATVLLGPHPSDATETQATLEDDRLRLTLSPPFLEKGVIRRCRLAAIWLPDDADTAQIEAALEQFASSPLPLTA